MPTFPAAMMHDSVWMDRIKYIEAEERYQLHVASKSQGSDSSVTTGAAELKPPEPTIENCVSSPPINEPNPPEPTIENQVSCPLINDITMIRENLVRCVSSMTTNTVADSHITQLEEENNATKSLIENLSLQVAELTLRVEKLERSTPEKTTSAPAPSKEEAAAEDSDDDFDIFGDIDEEEEEETEEEKKKKEELLRKYNEKKAKKPALIAKSNIILDVKPWDDATDMAVVEKKVRTIEIDGLLWGNSKLVPLAFGIKKLQISCVVEDEKVGSDLLSEEITKFEDVVQSVDVAAFNKI